VRHPQRGHRPGGGRHAAAAAGAGIGRSVARTACAGAGRADRRRYGGPGDAAVEEIPPAADLRHPSRGAAPANGETRVDGAWTDADREGTRVVRVVAPGRFAVSRVEIHFEPTPASLMPASVDIYEAAGARRTRLNEGQSGQWLRSLAADALLRREWPVATVMLTGPTQGPLELDFHNAANPSVARIVLAGTY
jgi:hypothetical protein